MSAFKVRFENDSPISAELVPTNESTRQSRLKGNRKTVEWILVDSDSEAEAIYIARKIIELLHDIQGE